MTTLDEPGRIHELRVTNIGEHRYRIQIDGHEVRPISMRIEFDRAAQCAIAKLTLPVVVENLEALAVLDIDLTGSNGGPLEEC